MFTEKELREMEKVSESTQNAVASNEATDAMSSGCSWG